MNVKWKFVFINWVCKKRFSENKPRQKTKCSTIVLHFELSHHYQQFVLMFYSCFARKVVSTDITLWKLSVFQCGYRTFSSIFSEPEWTLYLLKTCLELPSSMELGHMRHYLLLPWFWIYTYNPSCQEKSKTVRKGERSKYKIQQLQQNKKRLLHPSRVQYLVEE